MKNLLLSCFLFSFLMMSCTDKNKAKTTDNQSISTQDVEVKVLLDEANEMNAVTKDIEDLRNEIENSLKELED